ncbi:hypothetical protein [Crateriforma spongiae]|uniref:hypothetical protein n=1 Tax=Crateriforma spongiae TaxID=2724528 RepID=UPI0039AEE60D
MNDCNPEIDAQLNALSDLCCETLGTERTLDPDRVQRLTKALLMSGFVQKDSQPLSAEIESRARNRCLITAMHRGGELKAITESIQKAFNRQVTWESVQPSKDSGTRPANISSATDA